MIKRYVNAASLDACLSVKFDWSEFLRMFKIKLRLPLHPDRLTAHASVKSQHLSPVTVLPQSRILAELPIMRPLISQP